MPRLWHALRYSLRGLASVFRHESAFRQELLLVVVLTPVALLIPASWFQRALLLASLLLVLIVELLNSGLEATVDRISVEDDELARRAKDSGSAAVFLSLLNSLVVWVLVLIDVYG